MWFFLITKTHPTRVYIKKTLSLDDNNDNDDNDDDDDDDTFDNDVSDS